jgi:heme exporter protein A
MSGVQFKAAAIGKSFQRRKLFDGIEFTLATAQSISICGHNGAGKSTLLKILAGIMSPTQGSVHLTLDGREVKTIHHFRHIGYVAPYLQLYDEFSGWENLDLMRKIRKLNVPDERLPALMELVQLSTKNINPVRTYSSGMKQRLKYACALLHEPALLFLDEPTANLDGDGRKIVQGIVENHKMIGIVILATNEPQEIGWCEHFIDLDRK